MGLLARPTFRRDGTVAELPPPVPEIIKKSKLKTMEGTSGRLMPVVELTESRKNENHICTQNSQPGPDNRYPEDSEKTLYAMQISRS